MPYKIELTVSDEMMEDWIEQVSDEFIEDEKELKDKDGLILKLLDIAHGELQDCSLGDVDQWFPDYKFGKYFTK